MLSVLLALAAATPARPIGNPAEWISNSDYPSSESKRGVTGLTAFAVLVGKDGTVRDCTITASSGSVTLDATACALIRARAKFIPARDAKGVKIEGVFQSRVTGSFPPVLLLNCQLRRKYGLSRWTSMQKASLSSAG